MNPEVISKLTELLRSKVLTVFNQRMLISILIQIVVVLVIAPLVGGIIRKIKAFSQKRKGMPIYQMYIDLYKLISKDMVISEETTWIFRITPYVVLITSISAAILVPVSTRLSLPTFLGDFIMLISILACGRFFMVLAGLDAASTFGGMGSSREVMVSALFEPALMVCAFTLSIMANTSAVSGIMVYGNSMGKGILSPVFILLILSIFLILIAETARIPVDDPATHLELTMIHEAMLLEYSGKFLAFMELGAAIKQLIIITLLANIFIPTTALDTMFGAQYAVFVSLGFYVAKVIGISAIVAFAEIFTVKLRLLRVSELATFSFVAAFIGFVQFFILGGT